MGRSLNSVQKRKLHIHIFFIIYFVYYMGRINLDHVALILSLLQPLLSIELYKLYFKDYSKDNGLSQI